MKARLLLALAVGSLISLNSFADINGDGFYRVRNYGTSRWANLIDDYGSVDLVASTADLHALQLTKDTEKILTSPGSVVYLTKLNSGTFHYNVATQGTSLESLINYPINVGVSGSADGQALYFIWGTHGSITKYIADINPLNGDMYGEAAIPKTIENKYKQWLFLPINDTDNYFGATPTVNANGKLYCTLFTAFPYKPYSPGVKAFYINRVGFGMAEMIEITDAVPTGSPVIIQCAGNNVADNKLQLVETQNVLPANALRGVYFDYQSQSRNNYVPYNPATMRVLGKCSDGSLGFVTASIDKIPANTAYLIVPEESPAELKCVTTQEYEDNLPFAPESFYSSDSWVLYPVDEYNYKGTWDVPATSGDEGIFIKFYPNIATREIDRTIGSDINYGKDYRLNGSFGVADCTFSYGSPYSWVLSNWPGGQIDVTLNLKFNFVQFYAKVSGVNKVISNDKNYLKLIGNTICTDTTDEIRVLDLAGHIIAKSNTGMFDISTLYPGIYVAVAGNNSIKIVR